jgi:hypothetical protein
MDIFDRIKKDEGGPWDNTVRKLTVILCFLNWRDPFNPI